jgi:hypothetical protein
MKKKGWISVLVTIAVLFFVCIVYLLVTRQMTVPFLYRYKPGNRYTIATAWSDSPFLIDTAEMCPLEWASFGQHPVCEFMADPFVVRDGDDFYIFYEEMLPKMNSTWGDIAVLHSTDLTQWERIGVALDESFHLSFPNVFCYNGEWYMIPETGAINEIRLYKAEDFPMMWKYCATLLSDDNPVDPAIINHEGLWYLLYHSGEELKLFYSADLLSGWRIHPDSPIRKECGYQETRPAGNFLTVNDTVYYVTQRHDGGYGTSVVTYRIDSLTPTAFIEHRLADNPTISDHGNGWAKDGMHQLSSVYVPERGQYFCVMDGNKSSSVKEWGWDWNNFPFFRIRR